MEKSRVLEPRIAWVRSAAAVLTLYVRKYSLRLSHSMKGKYIRSFKNLFIVLWGGGRLDSSPPR